MKQRCMVLKGSLMPNSFAALGCCSGEKEHLVLRRKLPLQCHWLAARLAGRMTTSLGRSASSQ